MVVCAKVNNKEFYKSLGYLKFIIDALNIERYFNNLNYSNNNSIK